MPVVKTKNEKITAVAQATDKRAAIKKLVGDLSSLEVMADLIFVGTYVREEKTSGGIIIPPEVLQEDEFQGKVGLVLKKGPDALDDPSIDEWAVYSVKDGWPMSFNGYPCRLIPSDLIRCKTTKPELIF
jgi:co-chaperonin GroES (HSP10)